jgi:glycosyltransferase involved in cell wall biosynthesis
MYPSTTLHEETPAAEEEFAGRAGIVQRLLQPYRISVYDMIASKCRRGLSVFASRYDHNHQPLTQRELAIAQFAPANNRYFFNGKFDLCWQANLQRWLKTWQPDLVIVEANPRNLSTPLMIRWLRKHGCRVIGHGLGVMPLTSGFEWLRDFGRRKLIGHLDGVLAYSSLAGDQYYALGMPRDRIFVAHNAITSKPRHQPPQRPSHFVDRPILLFVGTLIPRKSVDLLLRACAQLRTSPRPRLQIVGEGPLKQDLQQLAESLAIDCEFLGDLRGAALNEIFDAADLFALPGTGGLAVQEAMAHALPVVVSKADGTEGDLVREENGWIIKPGDAEVLARTIDLALSNPTRIREMGAASYRIVSSEINIENMSSTFVRGMRTIASMPLRTK